MSCSARNNDCASAWLRTLAVGPVGMSITTWVDPAAAFFDSTEATSWPSLSRSSVRSTRMSRSSAGLMFIAPPQTMQPPSASTTRRMSSRPRSTRVMVSTVSAVPAGEVMARELVLGITRPSAVAMDTTIGVVRLPGNPPMQCLSTTTACGQLMRLPVCTMARVRLVTSAVLMRPPAQAARNAAISTLDKRPATMSPMMASNWFSLRCAP
ncbi:hypothetical protein GALL_427260 [mine drainage metagenome]|uniref:Uncharacterized protein n=1 Tax=mine drainage metagenome TaxID=410659 RepID=A0A1J5Q6U2_9ZZZZ